MGHLKWDCCSEVETLVTTSHRACETMKTGTVKWREEKLLRNNIRVNTILTESLK